ncbi:SusC/RagA family TonB-linked outer membrane protein [Chitinophaga rhizophila]|uniref:SusC/RagA family TonB-linked outer membrane protein n=1 Tax=Chitinophaga rhizophila TaxID=2866212 RepID=A0ABS7GC51_9BACT|nr:SusC/RagA family TonB-linked outer membrane protein [Chitinophaga rhizophila]MBW8685253.1 SusC/RagA family TonB-linked outer membrane protein [Chitinophaga rhizophila]
MKLTAILTLVFSLNLSARSYSQSVTITGKHLNLYDIFNSISKQTGYEFVYDEKMLKGTGAIDINLKSATIAEVLDKCLKDKPLSYTITDKIIVIRPRGIKKDIPVAAVQPAATVEGTVVDAAGQPLPNVAIQVKGTTRGVLADEKGHFSIQAESTDVLVFNLVGYDKKEVPVGTQTRLQIVLQESNKQLNTVVVTALGIKRSEKSITYSAQQVSGVELTKAKDPNLMNTLNGKVAGLTISSSSSGVGGSAKVILRGNKSGLGNNQALYVIDGIPVNNNTTNQPSSAFGGSSSYDGGDPISNMNPDDIESISVLKGASASALYGSQGVNGVILITTKSGKAGRTTINFTSSGTVNTLAYKPAFQNTYGQSTSTSGQSWGSKINGGTTDNLSSFFRTGNNLTNSISLSGGSEKMQTYFSYANTIGNGIQPNNKLSRNNISFKETGKFLNDKLTAEADVNYITQKIDNTPLSGLYFNPLTGLYLFPRGKALQPFQDNFEVYDPARRLMTQNWAFNEDIQQNPWWIVNRNPNSLNRNRLLLNASLKYEVNKWLSIQGRGNIDRINDVYEQKVYAGTVSALSSANGVYSYSNTTTTQQYGDFIANLNIPIGENFRVTGVVGGAIRDVITKGERFNSGQEGLNIPNLFVIQNFKVFNPLNSGTLQENHEQVQSVFGSANISYKDWAFLDLTARNDWSSNLAFTPSNSYFYPSVGLNVILSSVAKLPAFISFAKVRGSYAQVGNSPRPYQSLPAQYIFSAGGGFSLNTRSPFTNLIPEKTNSLEFGTEWRFFDNRLSADFTYYKTNTTNQTFEIRGSEATLNDFYFINAGNIQNEGVEAVVRYDVLRDTKLKWNTGLNFAANKNRIKELNDDQSYFTLSGASGSNYVSRFKVGGSFGDIYGTVLQRDEQGRVMIDANGNPIKQGGDYVYLGNSNTRWQLGWNNNLEYKDFTLSFLIDGKFGGKVMSITQAVMDQYGVSKATGDARDAGGVAVNGVDPNGNPVSVVDAQKWYSTVGGREAASQEYMYSATTVRLREVALGYTIPVANTGFVKALKLSLTGRNLLFFSKKAPFDPELTMSTGNGLSGVDIFMPPATRNYGLTLNATF